MIDLQVGVSFGPDHRVLLPVEAELWAKVIQKKLVEIRGKYAEMKSRKTWSESSLKTIDRQCENQCLPYLKILDMLVERRPIKMSLMNQ